jgi:transcriptional regulator with XRE-family HTH domain
LLERIGAAVAEARRLRGWSQEELAENVSLSRNHVGQIERGERMPSLPAMHALATALGLSLDAVVLGQEDRHAREWSAKAAALLKGIPAERRREVMEILQVMARPRRAP